MSPFLLLLSLISRSSCSLCVYTVQSINTHKIRLYRIYEYWNLILGSSLPYAGQCIVVVVAVLTFKIMRYLITVFLAGSLFQLSTLHGSLFKYTLIFIYIHCKHCLFSSIFVFGGSKAKSVSNLDAEQQQLVCGHMQ